MALNQKMETGSLLWDVAKATAFCQIEVVTLCQRPLSLSWGTAVLSLRAAEQV